MPQPHYRPSPKAFLPLACAAALATSLYAAPVTVHKAATLPALRPLPMSIGGRMLTTPSVAQAATSFGGTDDTYQWPGSYFRAAFQGTTVFFRIVHGDQILHIVVDGEPAASLVKPEPGAYQLEGLPPGKHAIRVLVATESQAGPNTFGGFAIPSDEKALTPALRHRQIEFIGDSHTVGYGNLSTTHTCTADQVWADTDDTQAFGALVAAHYDADDQIDAISGRGVVRNYNGFPADTLPQAYPYVLFDKKQKYTDPRWKPQLLVIALGTNDFSTPLNPGERWKTRDELHADYETTYLHFLAELRASNPNAWIIVWATDMAQGEIASEAQKVVEQRKKNGDARIAFLLVSGLSFGACDWHPGLADHQIIADKLIHLIDAHSMLGNNPGTAENLSPE
jgi:lysophospholipase L1-like esterase